jgi:uncharacterized protein (TIGR00266 family)
MNSEVLYGPSFSLLKLMMDDGETMKAEAGAMVSMSGNIEMETKMSGGGVFGALKKSVLGGESLFINNFKPTGGPGELTLAPSYPGDIIEMKLSNQTVFAQGGAYMASSPDIEIDTKFGGAKTFFSKEGLFVLKASGTGSVFFASYGALHELTLTEGQKYVVDTGHMVAWEDGVKYEVKKVGSWKSTLLSGEGLVCHLTGPGKIFLQTRSPGALASWIGALMPKR